MLAVEIYEKMTLAQLKEIAKELGLKNISKMKKNELIEEILNNSPNVIEKDGVLLKEKISPKISGEVKQEVIDEKKYLSFLVNKMGKLKRKI